MPLKLGTTNIGAIYKGTTPISAIYKGTTLVFSSFTWQEYLYEYLYHNLVPTTINSKSVQDKAKLVEIQGNSCVVNQLCNHYYTGTVTSSSGITKTYDPNTHTYHFYGQNTSGSRYTSSISNTSQKITLYSNHTYYFFGLKSNLSLSSAYVLFSGVNANKYLTSTDGTFITNFADEGWFEVRVEAGATVDFYVCPQFVDLTQQFPFDTPTSLDDTRVKRIIEQGYIPYNSGEIKDSVVGEISNAYGNIFDSSTRVVGKIKNDSGVETNDNVSNYFSQMIRVYPNQKITSNFKIQRFYYYGISGNWLRRTSTSQGIGTFTFPSDVYFIQIQVALNDLGGVSLNNLMLNYGDTLLPYVPYPSTQYLPSEYQEVEYLESTGEQYIDLPFGFRNTDEIYIKFAIDEEDIGGDRFAIQPTTWNNDNNRFSFGVIRNQLTTGYGAVGTETGRFQPLTTNDKKIHTWSYKNYIFKVEDLGLTKDVSEITFGGETTNLRLFYGYQTGSNTTLCYYRQVRNGVDIINLIPCYRKSDNVAGLYDLVNRLFYTNNGTGTFAIGKKVNNNTIIHLPAPLDLGGVNTAHNTFTITKTNYVFTRNVFDVDLGTLTFTNPSGQVYWTAPFTRNQEAQTLNILSSKGYTPKATLSEVRNNNLSVLITSGDIYLRDDSVSQTSDIDGTLEYKLATPQVINISRKHLGVVDLGSLSWTYQGNWDTTKKRFFAYFPSGSNVKAPSSSSIIPNAFSSIYIATTNNLFYSQNYNKTFAIVQSNDGPYIHLRNDEYTSATDFKNAMSGVYLFYETENEVQDFLDEMLIQSGGTVNGEWFSWKQNQLVQNLKTLTNPLTRLTFVSESNGVLTYSCDTSTNFAYGQTVQIVSGHKYYYRVKATLTTAGSCSIRFLNSSYNEIASIISVNVVVGKNDLYGIVTATGSDSNAMLCLYNAPATQGDNVSFYEWELIDLNKGFPTNTPTNINDPRIQFIINNGYIPTDINGTDTSITCEVLPNVELNYKCK